MAGNFALTLNPSGFNCTYQISGSNGSVVHNGLAFPYGPDSAHFSQGCAVTLSVISNTDKLISHVNWELYPTGEFLINKDSCGVTKTFYDFDNAQYYLPTGQYFWSPCSGDPVTGANISLYAGSNASGDQYVSVSVYFSDGSSESWSIPVNVELPNWDWTFTSPNSPSVNFQFGPYKASYTSGGNVINVDSTVSNWVDISPGGYVEGAAGTDYQFGGYFPGITPVTSQGTIYNTTNSNGVAYFIQLGITYGLQQQWYDCLTNVDYNLPVPNSYTDADGSQIPCLDHPLGGFASPQGYPYALWAVTRAPANSSPTGYVVPPPNTVQDPNGVNVPYIYDDPGFPFDDVANTMSNGQYHLIAPYKAYYSASFSTYMVWHPDSGIPIPLQRKDWSITQTMDNANCKANPSFTSGRCTPANWAGTCAQYFANGFSQPYGFLSWPGVIQDSFKKLSGTASKRSVSAPAGLPIPNFAPMGGGAALQSMFGMPYPKPAIPGYGGIGGGSMN